MATPGVAAVDDGALDDADDADADAGAFDDATLAALVGKGTRATGTVAPDGPLSASSRLTRPAASRTASRCGASMSMRARRAMRCSGRSSSIVTLTLPTSTSR